MDVSAEDEAGDISYSLLKCQSSLFFAPHTYTDNCKYIECCLLYPVYLKLQKKQTLIFMVPTVLLLFFIRCDASFNGNALLSGSGLS